MTGHTTAPAHHSAADIDHQHNLNGQGVAQHHDNHPCHAVINTARCRP